MSNNEDALRRADELEVSPHVLLTVRRASAAHIRRLVAENEALRKAVAAEREACAKICEYRFSDGALVIAEAIRARGAA